MVLGAHCKLGPRRTLTASGQRITGLTAPLTSHRTSPCMSAAGRRASGGDGAQAGADRRLDDAAAVPGSLSGPDLWSRIREVYQTARDTGAAYSIDTKPRVVEDGGIPFVVRVAVALMDKPKAPKKPDGDGPPPKFVNPFLPYDPAMWVAHLSDSHTCLLNKFNVVDHHLLVVTREFESQDDPVDERDVDATLAVLDAMPGGGLAFYNRGEFSGRSQPHKHVQIVPCPFLEDVAHEAPIDGVVTSAIAGARGVVELRALPYQGFAMGPPLGGSFASAAEAAAACAEVAGAAQAAGAAGSYNLLLCRRWAAAFPRSAEGSDPVSVNSLGYAGTMLVRSVQEMDHLTSVGPVRVLRDAGVPW